MRKVCRAFAFSIALGEENEALAIIMVRKSYGKMRGTRFKMHMEKSSVTRFLEQFIVGDIVKVDFASHRMPHPKFQGLTGRVVELKGNSYGVQVSDGGKSKVIFLRPEHLKR